MENLETRRMATSSLRPSSLPSFRVREHLFATHEVDIKKTDAYSVLRGLRILSESGSMISNPSYFKAYSPLDKQWIYYRITHIDSYGVSVDFKSRILGGPPKSSEVFSTTMSEAWKTWQTSESTRELYDAGSNVTGRIPH